MSIRDTDLPPEGFEYRTNDKIIGKSRVSDLNNPTQKAKHKSASFKINFIEDVVLKGHIDEASGGVQIRVDQRSPDLWISKRHILEQSSDLSREYEIGLDFVILKHGVSNGNTALHVHDEYEFLEI